MLGYYLSAFVWADIERLVKYLVGISEIDNLENDTWKWCVALKSCYCIECYARVHENMCDGVRCDHFKEYFPEFNLESAASAKRGAA